VTEEPDRQRTFHLVALGELDAKRSELQRLIDAVPRILASRSSQVDAARAHQQAATEKLKGFRAHLKTLELELARTEEAVQKAQRNLLTAKSNQEYSLLQDEIRRRSVERGDIETRILEQYEIIQQGEGLVAQADERLAQAEREHDEFVRRSQGEAEAHRAELEALDARRDQIRAALAADVLAIYDRTFAARGQGVGPMENGICQGCFSKLVMNDVVRLKAGRELVTCPACQRILYMPETLQAST